MLNFKKITSLKKYYYFNACGGKGGLCSCFLLF